MNTKPGCGLIWLYLYEHKAGLGCSMMRHSFYEHKAGLWLDMALPVGTQSRTVA